MRWPSGGFCNSESETLWSPASVQFSALHFLNKKGISFPPVSNKGDENVL